jgi:glycosyltransferase involved in cell wall biosynthesis
MKVSVVMITYGHEEYIKQAIEGVLMQQYNGVIELIVSNDRSPDQTDLVVKKIFENHANSSWIKYTNHDINLGMMPNLIWTLKQTTGKYIALCDGDDYWTDPLKLQKQVDFMEVNPDFSIIFHGVDIIKVNDQDLFRYPLSPKSVMTFFDLVKDHYIPTCSLLFKNIYLEKQIPLWLNNVGVGDIPLELLLSSTGKAKYLNEKMSCYRRNAGGITQTQNQKDNTRKIYVKMYGLLAHELGGLYYLRLQLKILRIRLGYLKSIMCK